MNIDYVQQLVLNSFNYLVQDYFIHNFIYDDEDFKEGRVDVYMGDLDTPLHTFKLSAVDLRTMLEEFEKFFGIELIEEKYWEKCPAEGMLSRKDPSYDAYLGMITLRESDIQLLPELTFRDIFNDLFCLVIRKLQETNFSVN